MIWFVREAFSLMSVSMLVAFMAVVATGISTV
jgi:hypothetical protein